ncbi:MAG TPA: translation initiation factor IF-3 [Streptosporangiaceae bacterium]|nr:translation initiation factor IF-3 [Streptosporangiaceae bacterium]
MTQGGHISTEPRINERIRVPEVRLVGPAGEQVGIVAINDALRLAQEADLDLVEVAPMARPPVAKLMDYGKFKYESALKARESRKNQAQTVIKEIKLRPKIDPHDYGTKKGHVERFLKQGDKVKVTIMFRGREQSRPELGFKLLQRLAGDIEELGFVESSPKQDGRNMIMVIGPHKRKADAMAATKAERADRAGRPSRGSEQAGTEAEASVSPDAAAVGQSSEAAESPAPQSPPPAQSSPAQSAQPRASQPQSSQPQSSQPRASAAAQQEPEPAPASPEAATPAGGASDAPPRPAAPRPATPRPSAPRPTAASPRPGPASSQAPKPSAPRATPGSSARPGPANSPAPKPMAPRGATAAARPAASTSAPKPGPARRSGDGPVPSPRTIAADSATSARKPGEADK